MAAKDGNTALQDVAQDIFIDLTRHHSRGYDTSATAVESFRRAKSFLDVAAQVADGTLKIEPLAARKPKLKEITRQRAKDDNTGWDPILDEHGRPVTEKRFVDPFAYAPNLSDDHPINQLFEPEDGRPPSERTKSARQTAAALN